VQRDRREGVAWGNPLKKRIPRAGLVPVREEAERGENKVGGVAEGSVIPGEGIARSTNDKSLSGS